MARPRKGREKAEKGERPRSKFHPRRWSTTALRKYARRLTPAEMANVLGELPMMKKSMLGQRGRACGDGGARAYKVAPATSTRHGSARVTNFHSCWREQSRGLF